jgi:hypothetical protein
MQPAGSIDGADRSIDPSTRKNAGLRMTKQYSKAREGRPKGCRNPRPLRATIRVPAHESGKNSLSRFSPAQRLYYAPARTLLASRGGADEASALHAHGRVAHRWSDAHDQQAAEQPHDVDSIVPALAKSARTGHPRHRKLEITWKLKGWATRRTGEIDSRGKPFYFNSSSRQISYWTRTAPLKPKAGLNAARANYPTQAKVGLEWGTR